MRTELLGLELTHARGILAKEGVEPEVTVTAAPKRTDREGVLRVVYAADDGRKLIVSRFVDPLEDAKK